MKFAAVVRRLDQVGRIVLPIGLRRMFDLNQNDPLEILVDGSDIILRKYQPSCVFCDNFATYKYKGTNICTRCTEALREKRTLDSREK